MNRRDAIKAVMAMPAVASIQVANVGPDDTIVIECDGILSQETTERIRQHLEQLWPGRKALVLSKGLHMKVVRS